MEMPKPWNLQRHLMVLYLLLLISTSSASSPVSPSSANAESDAFSTTGQVYTTCQSVNPASKCFKITAYAQLPNVYGHVSQEEATQELEEMLRKFAHPGQELLSFLCTLYFPPCSLDSHHSGQAAVSTNALTPLPCRSMCETALTSILQGRSQGQQDTSEWPVRCQSLPTERCYQLSEQGRVYYVHKTFSPSVSTKLSKRGGGGGGGVGKSEDEVVQFTSIEAELGQEDENSYDVEVVSLSSSHNPIRRYDITDLGDTDLFHGWADVQGHGAANDYCRVVGKGKRHFLSCNLAGTWGQGHHYVSQLGFDAGYPGTWFMRDMDGDGKDDYCRCVGPTSDSKVTCMKAGQNGFYGSTAQSGSQHTFTLPLSSGCHDKKVNAMFGE